MDAHAFLVIRAHTDRFGIAIADVREVVRVPDALASGGALRYAGCDLSVVDFGGYMGDGGPSGPEPGKIVILKGDPLRALRVTEVAGLFELEPAALSPARSMAVKGALGLSLRGVTRLKGDLVFLLDARGFVHALDGAPEPGAAVGGTPKEGA